MIIWNDAVVLLLKTFWNKGWTHAEIRTRLIEAVYAAIHWYDIVYVPSVDDWGPEREERQVKEFLLPYIHPERYIEFLDDFTVSKYLGYYIDSIKASDIGRLPDFPTRCHTCFESLIKNQCGHARHPWWATSGKEMNEIDRIDLANRNEIVAKLKEQQEKANEPK